jgi:quercetin dioxygenase-like cupin family protein
MRPGETIEAPNGGATPPPMHVHPHQEERITVVSGSGRSSSGGADRVLSPGDTVMSAGRVAHGRPRP